MYERATHKPRTATRKEGARVIPLPTSYSMSAPLTPTHFPDLLSQDRNILEAALHALQNCLQTVGVGVDLLHLSRPFDPQDYESFQQSVERASLFARELREYCFPPTVKLWTKSLAAAMEEAVHDSDSRGQTMRVVCHAPLAEPRLDWQQVIKTVQRAVFCAQALLPQDGGEILVESHVRRLSAQQFVDIRVHSHSIAPLVIEEKALFCPFACINNHQLGLRLVLVQQTAARLQGQFSFHKASPRHGCFALSFRA